MDNKELFLKELARNYAEELERLGVPVDEIILYGSYSRDEENEDSDIDLAVISTRFGLDEGLEFTGVLSKATRPFDVIIEPIGFSPSQMQTPRKYSFIENIKKEGKLLYKKAA